jgi:hypothetical protein
MLKQQQRYGSRCSRKYSQQMHDEMEKSSYLAAFVKLYDKPDSLRQI